MKKQFCSFLLALIFSFISAFAGNETRQLKFDALTINDGLSQGMVNSIIQDHYGFLWFGTKDGLNRYDGYHFIIYRHNISDANSIADNFIRFLFEDSKGRIWIATANNGLDMFDRETESFVHFKHDELNKNSISDDHVTIISEDKFGCIWVGTAYGLNRISISEKNKNISYGKKSINTTKTFLENNVVEISHIVLDKSNPEIDLYSRKKDFPLSDIFSSNFFIDQLGFVWISTQSMLFKIQPLTKKEIKVEKLDMSHYCNTKEFDKGLEKFIQVFVEDTANLKVYFTYEFGITCVDLKSNQITFLSEQKNQNGIFGHPAAIDKNGNIWTSEFQKLEWFNINTRQWTNITAQDDNISLMLNNVNCSYRDKSGNIWIGTTGYGLLKYNPRTEKFHTTDNLSIGWMMSTPDQKVIVNKYSQLINIFDPKLSEYSLSIKDADFSYLPYYIDFGITDAALQDTDGTFWIGKQRLYHYDPKSKKIEKFRDSDETVFPLFEDQNNNLWFSNENKFVCFNKISKQSLEYDYPIRPSRVPYDFLQVIYQDKKGVFWLGTINGLLRFDPLKNEWKHFKNNPADTTSLSFDLIFTICPDPVQPEKYLWIGTNGGGLNCFDKTTGKVVRYTQINGLPNDVIYGILSDTDNNLWMSTNKGISRFNITKKQFRNFEEKDGLQGNEFNRYAFCKTNNNILYFGGVNGFNYFDPKDLLENTFIPTVLITDIKLNNQSVSIHSANSILKKPAYLASEIELKYSQNIVTIEFASLDFTASKKNLYQYQLEGFDTTWIHSGTNQSATFTNLDPGTYQFNVKGSNNDGVWNEKAASIKIIVLPPWYMTWWFRISVALALASAVYSFYKYRINKILEIQEVRNTIARDLHDEIGSNLSTISIFSEVAGSQLKPDNETNLLLRKISEYTQVSQDAMSDIVWMINSNNDRFENILFRMESYAREIVEAKNIRLNFIADENLKDIKLEMSERRCFYLIFKEAVNNLAKYAEATHVDVIFKLKDKVLTMEISDNGKGFDVSKKNNGNLHHGNGLTNLKKRTEALKGELFINSQPGKGTKIELKFKVKKA